MAQSSVTPYTSLNKNWDNFQSTPCGIGAMRGELFEVFAIPSFLLIGLIHYLAG